MSNHRSGVAWAIRRVVPLALLLTLGCMTTSGPDSEETARLKKARSHLNLGVDYLRTHRVALGLRELLLAESFDPKNARIQYAIADAYLMRGKFDDAEARYRRVLELVPDYHDARLNLAALYLRLGRHEEGLAESRLLADDATFPGPWRALSNQGWAELQLGRLGDARASLELARSYNPGYWPTLLNLGILEMEQGNRLESISLFRQVIDKRPAPAAQAEANYRLGKIYVALGKRDRAVEHLISAVTDAPEGEWGVKSAEYLKLLR